MKNKMAYTIVRVLLGLAWIFYGVTKFLALPAPALPDAASAFLGAMAATGYFIPVIGIFELAAGLMLLFNRWVPFSMMILSAVMIHVILFNLFLAFSGVGMIMLLVLTVMQVYIMYCTWGAYKPLFIRQKH